MAARPVRADLDAEVVAAEEPDQRAGAEAGLEGDSGIIGGCVLVDRRLDPAAGVIEQQRRRVDREPVEAVRRSPAEAETLRRKVRLRHRDVGDAVGEGHRGG